MCIFPFWPTSLFHYLGALSLTSNYFFCLHGKDSTFFYSKFHHISTKDMNGCTIVSVCSWKTAGKQLQIVHEQRVIQLVFFLSPFIACVYLSKCQWQRSLFTWTSLRSSQLDVSNNFHWSILFSKKFVTLFAGRNNSIVTLIKLCRTSHTLSCSLSMPYINSFPFPCNLSTQSDQ